jgi:hypothetical protein
MGGANYISKREPGVGPEPVMVERVAPPTNAVAEEDQPKEVFVRSKELKIRQVAPVNRTGSLTDLNDPRAYLFGFERPMEIGQFIDVKVASNRSDNEAPKSADGSSSSNAGSNAKPAEEAELLKALPNLDPAGKNKPVLVKSIKMQILERYPNGDALVMYKRRSLREGQGSEINVTGRVGAEALTRPDSISTLDLADIDWRESVDGEVVERRSANWEDEFSLRISGFDETKSKDALALEEKRNMLQSARDKLENEMKSVGQERAKMSKERSALLDEKAKDKTKIAELEEQNKDLQKQVDDLSPKDQSPEDSDATDASKTDKKKEDKAPTADKKKEEKAPEAKEKPQGKKDDKAGNEQKTKPKAEPKKPAAAKKG